MRNEELVSFILESNRAGYAEGDLKKNGLKKLIAQPQLHSKKDIGSLMITFLEASHTGEES